MLLGSGDIVEAGSDGAAILKPGNRADLKLRESTILAWLVLLAGAVD
jgi:hypothetical protein